MVWYGVVNRATVIIWTEIRDVIGAKKSERKKKRRNRSDIWALKKISKGFGKARRII